MTQTQTYAITGATGHIGRRIAQQLLDAGKNVRILIRDKAKAADLIAQGADAFVGSVEDAAFVRRAFTGIDAAFIMIPPAFHVEDLRAWQNQVAENMVQAVASNGVKHVVNLSSVGAHLDHGTGPIKGLHDQEQKLNAASGLNVVHLRPVFFMENLYNGIASVAEGFIGSGFSATAPFAMIATRDIADVATARLLALDFEGAVIQDLNGAGVYTMNEVAAEVSRALGRTINYVAYPYEDAHRAMVGQGMSADVADNFIEIYRGFNEGHITFSPRTQANTTPTTLAAFIPQLLEAVPTTT